MKAPFKILYSNDLTHIECCVSPYRRRGETFRGEMLNASVYETAGLGIDVHILQPGMGWVPLWQSKSLPPEKHWEWTQKTYHVEKPNGYIQYLLDGGDIVADFTKCCREKQLMPFISLRMNDNHHLDKIKQTMADYTQLSFCKFYYDHPEYRLETATSSFRDRGQNWAVPAVREYKFNFIRELCENYDIDGIELDFMRAPYLFRSFETTSEQREEIMTEFIARVRRLLDETATEGRRWLCVKLPIDCCLLDSIGMNVSRLADTGVDMFNWSYSYYTAQDGDLAFIRRLAPQAAMYVEMTSCSSLGRAVDRAPGDNYEFMKTSTEQFYTTAESIYDAGMDGVSLFNFVYYREHGSAGKRGAVGEPPFEIIHNLRDREFLSRQNHCYFIGSHWQDDGPLPKAMMLLGQYVNFMLQNVVLANGTTQALLKVHINNPEAGNWEAWFNDHPVFKAKDSSVSGTSIDGKVLIWDIPLEFLVTGDNNIEFRSEDIVLSVIDYIELTIRRKK